MLVAWVMPVTTVLTARLGTVNVGAALAPVAASSMNDKIAKVVVALCRIVNNDTCLFMFM